MKSLSHLAALDSRFINPGGLMFNTNGKRG
jgi:hypothetical protein